MCLAHASEAEQDSALSVMNESGMIDGRGVPFTNTLLNRVLTAMPRADDGQAVLRTSLFDRAIFTNDAPFSGVTFAGDARFARTTFTGTAWFRYATFHGNAEFDGATFTDTAWFDNATFHSNAGFKGAVFSGDARFPATTFHSNAEFDATFHSRVGFGGAAFHNRVVFSRATFPDVASFTGANFIRDAWFTGTTFTREAQFERAAFASTTSFREATFGSTAWFDEANFTGTAEFAGANFTGHARFPGTTFTSGAWFNKATFHGNAEFDGATFASTTEFGGANFTRTAAFARATFSGYAGFDTVTFTGDATFPGARFTGDARFKGARFEQARQFGPLLAYQGLVLDEVQFAQPVQIEVSSTGVCCRRAQFPGGVQFRLRWARVVLDDTDLAAPSILAGISHLSSEELARREEQIATAWQRELAGEITEWPQLMSLRRANVAGLGLSNVSAVDCRFAGAHNLDKLRLESDVSFATAPSPVGSSRPKWGGREVIAEERAWRADPRRANRSRRHWAAPRWPGWLDDQPDVLDPGQIAGLYRALRKGREDVKDEPGAADFYYGEMEMRRKRPVNSGTPNHQSSTTTKEQAERSILTAYLPVFGYGLRAWLAGQYRALRKGRQDVNPGDQSSTTVQGRAERGILTAYWLVSGYSLRAWRAVATLAVLTALLAVAFHLVGFAIPPRPVSYWTSLLYAFRATLSLTDDQVKLTAWGQLLQGVLRLTGPVLLGLALLALRGRVKR
jgi:hypothetical protein